MPSANAAASGGGDGGCSVAAATGGVSAACSAGRLLAPSTACCTRTLGTRGRSSTRVVLPSEVNAAGTAGDACSCRLACVEPSPPWSGRSGRSTGTATTAVSSAAPSRWMAGSATSAATPPVERVASANSRAEDNAATRAGGSARPWAAAADGTYDRDAGSGSSAAGASVVLGIAELCAEGCRNRSCCCGCCCRGSGGGRSCDCVPLTPPAAAACSWTAPARCSPRRASARDARSVGSRSVRTLTNASHSAATARPARSVRERRQAAGTQLARPVRRDARRRRPGRLAASGGREASMCALVGREDEET
eukprot:1701670-Prymnesium_polylepis.1